jgi:hypothetical protein
MSTKENEFSRRDAMGLKPLLPDAKSEAQMIIAALVGIIAVQAIV